MRQPDRGACECGAIASRPPASRIPARRRIPRRAALVAFVFVICGLTTRDGRTAGPATAELGISGGPAANVSSDSSRGPALTFGEIPTIRTVRRGARIDFVADFASLATGRAADDGRVRRAFAAARLRRATVSLPIRGLLATVSERPEVRRRTLSLAGTITIGSVTRPATIVVETLHSRRTSIDVEMTISVKLADFAVSAVAYRDASIAGITLTIGFAAN